MQRRAFLKTLAALPALGVAGRLFAAPTSGPRFLLVFLRGGYDSNHLLVPYASDFYYEARPHIAIARPGSGADAATRLDDAWALAPAVHDSLGALYAQRQVAFVPFAGTDDLSRSHFETQDDVESGETAAQRHGFHSGFMARLAGVLGRQAAPIAFTRSLPLSFQGGHGDIPNLSLRGRTRAAFTPRQVDLLQAMYEGTPLQAPVRDGLKLRQQVAGKFAEEMVHASRGAVNPGGFATETARIATLMRDQFRLGFVDVGGWDTHVNQGDARGVLANNLANLGRGLEAFARGMGDEWKHTVVAVISEFGRTFRENGDRGTDHGHGTVYTFLGGALRGGRILGEQRAVTRANLLQDRDYPVLNNYRAVFGGLFQRLWGLSDEHVNQVFPGAPPRDLGLV
ncbi:DUF1501 domain-containing protein [Oleiagrimonas soli]|uniref:Uncharacterized protein (DUF1501 family) n=1 Tax=Oleiagrimonas soli TaxID=1543381 RepID=A0A099CV29_9GAMM|nr:DUF1501 domain-containing protein [Oleiagrimonas soli]KGI77639.1 hypothetical protein LF63_0110115 [Oleiagrimonas soli]MBB6182860.1 uncharacterized protein (DUF1501 family) [Oleiagrimonas soli]